MCFTSLDIVCRWINRYSRSNTPAFADENMHTHSTLAHRLDLFDKQFAMMRHLNLMMPVEALDFRCPFKFHDNFALFFFIGKTVPFGYFSMQYKEWGRERVRERGMDIHTNVVYICKIEMMIGFDENVPFFNLLVHQTFGPRNESERERDSQITANIMEIMKGKNSDMMIQIILRIECQFCWNCEYSRTHTHIFPYLMD